MINTIKTKKNIPLRINKKLPQIVLPKEKNEYFIEWYDKDLRFQDEIPNSFDRGYLFIEGTLYNKEQLNNKIYRELFKNIAKDFNETYRAIENAFIDYINITKNTIIYFEFENNSLKMQIYLENRLYHELTLNLSKLDSSKPNPTLLEIQAELYNNGKSLQEIYARYCLILLECCLWYIATTTKTTKYYRQEKQQPYFYEKKEVINIKRNKVISTPIYDMNKIRRVKVEGLIKRRKGWTYSHSFQVHGHYRHYQDGKVIFIKPYIKGKGKEEISQKIILNPKEEK